MQEIVVSRGKTLELLRPDANTGKVHTLLTMEVFGIIRSLMAFRLTGGTKGVCVCACAPVLERKQVKASLEGLNTVLLCVYELDIN